MKLEIALAISALNDEKYNSNNSAGQGLMLAQYWLNVLYLLGFSTKNG